MKRIIIFAVMSVFFSTVIYAAEKSGAKALFYTGEGPTISATTPKKAEDKQGLGEQSKKEKYMGIAYWIDLLKTDGEQVRTTTKKEFKSGERIKLNLKSNKDGYLYIINIGSTGTSRILFPHSGNIDNFVTANEIYTVPCNKYMKFDENPGEETLLVLLSPKQIKEILPASPTIKAEESNTFVAYAKSKGAKDLVLEDDTSAGAKTAQYAVAPMSSLDNGEAISLYIKLKHN